MGIFASFRIDDVKYSCFCKLKLFTQTRKKKFFVQVQICRRKNGMSFIEWLINRARKSRRTLQS